MKKEWGQHTYSSSNFALENRHHGIGTPNPLSDGIHA